MIAKMDAVDKEREDVINLLKLPTPKRCVDP